MDIQILCTCIVYESSVFSWCLWFFYFAFFVVFFFDVSTTVIFLNSIRPLTQLCGIGILQRTIRFRQNVLYWIFHRPFHQLVAIYPIQPRLNKNITNAIFFLSKNMKKKKTKNYTFTRITRWQIWRTNIYQNYLYQDQFCTRKSMVLKSVGKKRGY